MKRTISVRAAALAAVAALGLSGLGLGAAFAAPEDGNPTDVADVSSINQTTGTLNIHKFTPTTSGNGPKANGTEITSTSLPGAKAIKGIQFKVWKIKTADIKTNEAWRAIEQLSTKFNKAVGADAKKKVLTDAHYTLEPATVPNAARTTNEQGLAQFTDLPIGFYYVEETTPTDSGTYEIDGKAVKGSKITGAKPFIIAVPLTNPNNHREWMYEVHVYPKNSVTDNEKSVLDEPAHGSGNNDDTSNLVYTIKTDLPFGVDNYQSYKIVDPLDEKLKYVGDSSTSQDVVTAINAKGADVATFTAPDDYTITKSDPNKRTVTLEFTLNGRAKLITARNNNEAVKVQWKLHARLLDTEGKTDIPNTAYQLPTNKVNPDWNSVDKPGTPTNTVISKYGKVVVTKKGSGADANGLDGAKFALYICDSKGIIDRGKRVKVDNTEEWTSTTVGSKKGQIVIDGLRLNDWMNQSPVDGGLISPATEYYCLEELQAPAGYELLPNPIKFQLLTSDSEFEKSFDVKNVPSNGGFELPVTGGQGIALLVTAGGLLVAGSVIYTVAAARKRKQQA